MIELTRATHLFKLGKTFKKMLLEDELSLNYFLYQHNSPLFLEKVLRNIRDAGTFGVI